MIKTALAFAAFAIALPAAALATTVPTNLQYLKHSGNGRVLVVGDSTTVELCSHDPAKAWGNLMADALGMPVDNLGVPGLQTIQIQEEIGTPGHAKVANDYPVVDVGTMTNEEQQALHFQGKYGITIANAIKNYELEFKQIRELEPHALIVNMGLRDLVYNAYPVPENGSFTPALAALDRAMIGDYVAAAQTWMDAQPGMVYMSLWPAVPRYYSETSYLPYYAKNMICGPAHPGLNAEPYLAQYALNELSTIAP